MKWHKIDKIRHIVIENEQIVVEYTYHAHRGEKAQQAALTPYRLSRRFEVAITFFSFKERWEEVERWKSNRDMIGPENLTDGDTDRGAV